MAKACDSLKTTTTPPSFGSDDPPDYSIMPTGQPAPPNPDAVASDWVSSTCKPGAKYRFTSEGKVEVDGAGIPMASHSEEAWHQVDRWRQLLWETADAAGLSRALLAAVVMTESGGNANARGSAGELGLMQLLPKTARMVASPDFPTGDPVDVHEQTILQPAWNLAHGAKVLMFLMNQTQGNLISTMSSYNHGRVECGSACNPNTWNTQTECGYVDTVIANMNFAVDAGYAGPVQIALGDGGVELKSSTLVSVLVGLALGGAAIYSYRKWGKKL